MVNRLSVNVEKGLKAVGWAIVSGAITGAINVIYNMPATADFAVFGVLLGVFEAARNYLKHKDDK